MKTLFDNQRINMIESIELTIQSLNSYGERHPFWVMAWSGGKDSTATLTLIVHLIESGKLKYPPERLLVLFADTRMELTPIYLSALSIIENLKERNIDVKTVMAPIEKRFLPYILGRGVPPPNNNTFRWCTRQIKCDPMRKELEKISSENTLCITGVRQGESAIRDGRISMSCSRDGAECGQGWYQQMKGAWATLAPILHWRVCHVWNWLRHFAPQPVFGDWDTEILADAYGGDEAEEINARTGCVGCPLAQKDKALDAVLKIERWKYLAPLKRLRPIYRELRSGKNRLRQTGNQRNQDGSIPKNPNRMGPLTIDARMKAFEEIMQIQSEINQNVPSWMQPVDLLNQEEINYIKKCWDENLFPNGWTGDEPLATELIDQIYPDGSVQPLLFY